MVGSSVTAALGIHCFCFVGAICMFLFFVLSFRDCCRMILAGQSSSEQRILNGDSHHDTKLSVQMSRYVTLHPMCALSVLTFSFSGKAGHVFVPACAYYMARLRCVAANPLERPQ